MESVYILGTGQAPVAEHWDRSLRDLAAQAAEQALTGAGIDQPDVLVTASMLSGPIAGQEHLGALVADHLGWRGIEALRAEAADASGAAALRQAVIAVASGQARYALALGVEKFSDVGGADRLAAQAMTLDADLEAAQGATPAALAALLMRRYMHQHNAPLEAFAAFSINAHANAATNPNAMFRSVLKPGQYERAAAIAPPVGLFDAAPEGDGAAAVLIGREPAPGAVRVIASAAASDALSLQRRADPLRLAAVERSSAQALRQAGLPLGDISLFELHDSFTIMAVLALEACGLASAGSGWRLGDAAHIGLKGTQPLNTFGGLKARGHAGGASGLYQAVEAVAQLQGRAGPNQVEGAQAALIQAVAGLGGTAVTHILSI